jgi:hypothetical protein
LILIGASSLASDGGNSWVKFFFSRNLFHWPLIGDILMEFATFVGDFSTSLDLGLRRADDFDDPDLNNMFEINAIATVIIKTRVAATGYHFGGAVKVVIPKIDYIKFSNADFNLLGFTHCHET